MAKPTRRSRTPTLGPAAFAGAALAALLLASAVSAADTVPAPAPATNAVTPAAPARTYDRAGQLIVGVAVPSMSTMPATVVGPIAPSVAPPAGPATQPATAGARPTLAMAAVSELEGSAINRGQTPTAPTTQATSQKNDTPSVTSFEPGRVVLSLAAVVGLILFLKWGSKKVFALPSASGAGVMQVVSRTNLAPKQQMLLVRVGRRLMVIGDSGGRLTGLGEITDPDEVASLLGQTQTAQAAPSASASFGSMFRRIGSGRGGAAGWEELQRDSTTGLIAERSGLLGQLDAADVDRDDLDPTLDRAAETIGDDDEAAAEKAVEAARYDIQALRAKLREVTGRLTDTTGDSTANPPDRPREPGTSDAA